MSAAGYPVTQLQAPSQEAFAAALAEAGIEWAWDDVLERHRHPGVRLDGATVGLVVHTVSFDHEADRIGVVQSALVLGPDCGVVARWPGDQLDEVFAEDQPDRGRVAAAVVEAVHDAAVEVLTDFEERVDDTELEVLGEDGRGASAQTIYHLEHELLALRRSVAPMVGLLDKLGRRTEPASRERITEWRDRFARLVSQIEDLDNLLTSVLSVNLTLVSVRQNEDMRRIAAWGAIGIAPTAMAGIWGMNFRHMPELDWGVGYPVALASIVVVCALLYRFFRRAGWL